MNAYYELGYSDLSLEEWLVSPHPCSLRIKLSSGKILNPELSQKA